MGFCLADAVRTVKDLAGEAGCVGAWALDYGLVGEVHVNVLEAIADAPTSIPRVGEVFVWFGTPIKADTALLDAAESILEAREQIAAKRFQKEGDRSNFIASHAALRAMLGAALNVRPLDVHISCGPHGKPRLCVHKHPEACAGLHFNISHTRGLVAVALAGCPVGIDVEVPTRLAERDHVAHSMFAPEFFAKLTALQSEDARDALFYRSWTFGGSLHQSHWPGIEPGA